MRLGVTQCTHLCICITKMLRKRVHHAEIVRPTSVLCALGVKYRVPTENLGTVDMENGHGKVMENTFSKSVGTSTVFEKKSIIN